MTTATMSKQRELVLGLIGLAIICVIAGGIGWVAWTLYSTTPQRVLAGTWEYDASSPANKAGTGQGHRLQFSGQSLGVFDAAGRQIRSLDWATHTYSTLSGDFPIVLTLETAERKPGEEAVISLSSDRSRMMFGFPGTVAREFRRVR